MSKRFAKLLLTLALAAACLPLAAQTYAFQAFSYSHFPNVDTYPSGINNRGAVVGTIVYVGSQPCSFGYISRGFKRHADGVFEKPIDDPNLKSGAPYCYLNAVGINKYGEISGSYYDNYRKGESGFLINNGVFSSYLIPGSSQTAIYGINGNGDFVGLSDVLPHAFVNVNGVVSQFRYPGASSTMALGIAADDTVVGFVHISGRHQAFLRGPAGQFALLKVPGADSSYAYGINNVAHQIVGYYYDGVRNRGFVYDYITGAYTTVEYPEPNILSTVITGVNSQGVIVGYAKVTDSQGHPLPSFGFVGTPQ